MNDLKKISEGQSGLQVANIIYDNDNKLYSLFENCRDELDANKAYVAKINSGGNQTLLSVVSTTGTSTTDVMSQQAVTNAIESVQTSMGNACLIANVDIPEVGYEVSVTSNTTKELLARIQALEERVSKLES
jgi:hypothetical protein